ncbi:MAG: deoxynucleoside kinase [Treponema sp.]|nr:deoxynucleoside kinase [Treponema sp.]
MHIAIEGMDGVGKTTVCRILAQKLGFTFVEKPLHYIFDDSPQSVEQYQKIARRVNESPDRDFTAWFYGLNNLFLHSKFKGQNIITDRHIVSNYCWSGAGCNSDIYDLLIKKIGMPDYTIILYADPQAIEYRLKQRDENDPNLSKLALSELAYARMISFCREKKFPFTVVDTSDNNSPEQIANLIVYQLNKLIYNQEIPFGEFKYEK